ncbi:hypothetical protein [Bradyrhizobium sp. 27S5]|uniref:hypothetical protein n=1 Tax=Bradyrhizobium sp. 27S5 TaxID=3139728 RepID=UPI0030CC0E83
MGYFDELRKGSAFHRSDIKTDRTFSISAADESLDAMAAFQRMVQDAFRHEGEDGYRITTANRYTQHSLPGHEGQTVYDFLVITRD